MGTTRDKNGMTGSRSLAAEFQIKRIDLLERFLTAEQVADLKAALDAYYLIKVEQSEAVKRKEGNPRTRSAAPRMDDEVNILEVAGKPHSKAIRTILDHSMLPEMPKPTGLRNVDGTPSGYTTLAERLWLALCQFQTERAKLDTGQTSLDARCDWRDEYVSRSLKEVISDLAKASGLAEAP